MRSAHTLCLLRKRLLILWVIGLISKLHTDKPGIAGKPLDAMLEIGETRPTSPENHILLSLRQAGLYTATPCQIADSRCGAGVRFLQR